MPLYAEALLETLDAGTFPWWSGMPQEFEDPVGGLGPVPTCRVQGDGVASGFGAEDEPCELSFGAQADSAARGTGDRAQTFIFRR